MTKAHKCNVIYLVYGNPGAGKSTISRRLKVSIPQAILLSNDTIRKHFKCPLTNSIDTQKVYSFVAEEACKYSEQNKPVIIDATFYSKRYRKLLFDRLHMQAPIYVLIQIVTPTDICRKRVQIRKNNPSLQGMRDIDSFERCVAKTEAWVHDEIPSKWYQVEIDCSRKDPCVITYSSNIPTSIIQKIQDTMEDQNHGI